MQTIYSRYRDMKKSIRDSAAVDVQRVVRGRLVRSRIARFAGFVTKFSGGGGSSGSSQNTTLPLSMVDGGKGTGGMTDFKEKQGVNEGDKGVIRDYNRNMGMGVGSASPETYARYRVLLTQKRDLKRELKHFDDQFQEKYGKAPKKADKEVNEHIIPLLYTVVLILILHSDLIIV